MFNLINPATIFSRNQNIIAPERQSVYNVPSIDYSAFGILPGAAQNLQETPYLAQLTPPPAFNTEQVSWANWFTTRVHLSPLGKV